MTMRFLRGAAWFLAGAAITLAGQLSQRTQLEEYNAEVRKTIVELQQFRQTNTIRIRSTDRKEGAVSLVSLNPAINVWFLLKIEWNGASPANVYHLENTKPAANRLLLDDKYPTGIVIASGSGRYLCDLSLAGDAGALEQARNSARVFYPLCGGRVYLRNAAKGNRTTLEATTEFLRDHVWGGEAIISLGHTLLGERNRETGELRPNVPAAPGTNRDEGPAGFPLAAAIDRRYADRLLTAGNLGMELEGAGRAGMTPGLWYAAAGNPGIFVSILQANLIVPALLQSYPARVNRLDNVEASALCYLLAFDLDRFDLGYALGTEHPRVEWSGHMRVEMKKPGLPGPDGIGSIAPLVSSGLVSPEHSARTVATFTGGFKRAHGAFQFGELSLRNFGSHYGFIEDGVVFSKLQPGLSTVFVTADNAAGMKTWSEQDNAMLARIKHARQNGVPLIDFDAAAQSPAPGVLVSRWGPGNWSGSADERLRTMRSGVALQKNRGKRFLIYAVFSDATPSAMARVFQAYACDYAMLLDMNALEHTYAAVYRRSGSKMAVDHLIRGMSDLDKTVAGEIVPRFLGFPDNRDFFYVMTRRTKEIGK